MTLGCPAESEAQLNPSVVSDWVAAWQCWRGPAEVVWCERRWRTLGIQKLPERVLLASAGAVAQWIGEDTRWERATRQYGELTARWPALGDRLPRHYDALAEYGDDDIQRLSAILSWLEANPKSNLYPRQLPVAGIDTKWLEARLPMIADLLDGLSGNGTGSLNCYERCGLREPRTMVRFRLLDHGLRERSGGLGDIAAPIEDIAAMRLGVAKVFIVENLQTGLAFEGYPRAAVFMGLGYGACVLARVPWVCEAECIYWGDLDTHGFAILNQARSCLPRVASVLMDEETLLRYRHLWGEEKEQYSGPALHLLTAAEGAVYSGLKQQRWGKQVRLEQERVAWDDAWAALRRMST